MKEIKDLGNVLIVNRQNEHRLLRILNYHKCIKPSTKIKA